MSVTVRVEIDNRELRQRMGQLQRQLQNVRQAEIAIANEVKQVIWQAFQNETSPTGRPWAPLSSTTIRRHGRSGKKLQRTGRLKNSIRVKVEGNTLSVEARNPYAGTHQWGAPFNKAWGRGRAPIPARPFFPITTLNDVTPEMAARIDALLAQHFNIER